MSGNPDQNPDKVSREVEETIVYRSPFGEWRGLESQDRHFPLVVPSVHGSSSFPSTKSEVNFMVVLPTYTVPVGAWSPLPRSLIPVDVFVFHTHSHGTSVFVRSVSCRDGP